MSASFPSSWEPYGSSQQPALSWRPPATGPSQKRRTTPSLPLSFLRKSKPPPAAPSKSPPPTPSHERQLAEIERDTRLEQRFDAVRADIRAVSDVQHRLEKRIDDLALQAVQRTRNLSETIASVQRAVATVSTDVRNLAEQSKRLARETERRHHADIHTCIRAVHELATGLPQLVQTAATECMQRLAPARSGSQNYRVLLRLPLAPNGQRRSGRDAAEVAPLRQTPVEDMVQLSDELDIFEDVQRYQTCDHSPPASPTVSDLSPSRPDTDESAWRQDASPRAMGRRAPSLPEASFDDSSSGSGERWEIAHKRKRMASKRRRGSRRLGRGSSKRGRANSSTW